MSSQAQGHRGQPHRLEFRLGRPRFPHREGQRHRARQPPDNSAEMDNSRRRSSYDRPGATGASTARASAEKRSTTPMGSRERAKTTPANGVSHGSTEPGRTPTFFSACTRSSRSQSRTRLRAAFHPHSREDYRGRLPNEGERGPCQDSEDAQPDERDPRRAEARRQRRQTS